MFDRLLQDAGTADEGCAAVEFLTPWMAEPEQSSIPDRHALFRELAFRLIESRYPWLMRILGKTGSQVLAMPGRLYVAVPSAPADWIEISELSALLRLVPWAEDGEVAH